MGTYRMYTDGSGDTTWEPVDLNERADWLEGFETTNIRFGLRPPNVVQDWHPGAAAAVRRHPVGAAPDQVP